MTNQSGGFRDPTGHGSSRIIAIVLAVIAVLLLLAWFGGVFGAANEAVEVDGDEAVVTEDGAVVSEEAVEEAEDAAD